ncbi:MAG: AAA family ATPase [Chloroflexi bacterium]|nr:AAA family ATPase [Chloroflexota bacterium]
MIHGRLYLFGDPYLVAGERADVGRDALLLLAYLALRPTRPVERRRLAFLLWPDVSEGEAFRRLRQQLHRLRRLFTGRKALDSVLQTDAGHVWLEPDQGMWVDVLAFQKWAAQKSRRAEAAALYRGDLMASYEAVTWLKPIRERLREQYLALLRSLIESARRERRSEQALAYAKRLLQAAPWRESSHRVYMEVLCEQGRRVEALQHYRLWERKLQEMFGMEPAAETRRLYERICDASVSLHSRPFASAMPTQQERSSGNPLVGRENEWRALDEGLSQVLAGHGRCAFVSGENGLGRSYLVEQWLQARSEHLLTFVAGCEEMSGRGLSIMAALQAGRKHIDWAWFPPQYPALAEFRRQIAGEIPHRPLPPHQIGQFLLTLAERASQPVALALQNIHHADEETWEVLVYVARRCARTRLYLLATCQPETLNARCARLMRSLQRLPHVAFLALQPLTREQTAQLARHYLGREPEPAFVDALYRLTEGYPYFIVAYVQAAQRHGQTIRLPALPMPVNELMRECLARVGAEGQALLAAAARLGSEFDLVSLAESTPDLDEERRLAALETCLHRGLLQETPRGYRFSHIQIRRAAEGAQSHEWQLE